MLAAGGGLSLFSSVCMLGACSPLQTPETSPVMVNEGIEVNIKDRVGAKSS